MGFQTRTTLVSTALNLAGKTNLTTLANTWLQLWLDKTAFDYPWTKLQKRNGDKTLASGTQSFTIGNGSVEALAIQRFFEPIEVFDSTYSTRVWARIQPLRANDFQDEHALNPATNVGTPIMFKIRAESSPEGRWRFWPQPIPDKDYILALDYLVVPAALSADSDIPWYPCDDTMVQAVYVRTLQYLKDEREPEEHERLKAMVLGDRVKFGDRHDSNPGPKLDEFIFRP